LKVRKKPIVVEAERWWVNGDHSLDASETICRDAIGNAIKTEGKIVRFIRNHKFEFQQTCNYCSRPVHLHGWIETLEGGHVVCPGDWIITGIKGEMYPCKPDIFEESYEPV
jgi:hypothetical protein